MDRDDLTIERLGAGLAAAFGYANGGADALRFYLMHRTRLPARTVLAMRPHELLDAYDSQGRCEPASTALH